MGIPWLIIGMVTARQRHTPPRLQGRVAGATSLATNGPQSVSIALGAALVDAVDYRVLIAGCTAVVLASGLGPLLRPVRAPTPVAAPA